VLLANTDLSAVDDAFEAVDTREFITTRMAQLTTKQRLVVTRLLAGDALGSIAHREGVSKKAICHRLRAALQRMRQDGGGEGAGVGSLAVRARNGCPSDLRARSSTQKIN
jgi:hypothetical protein